MIVMHSYGWKESLKRGKSQNCAFEILVEMIVFPVCVYIHFRESPCYFEREKKLSEIWWKNHSCLLPRKYAEKSKMKMARFPLGHSDKSNNFLSANAYGGQLGNTIIWLWYSYMKNLYQIFHIELTTPPTHNASKRKRVKYISFRPFLRAS